MTSQRDDVVTSPLSGRLSLAALGDRRDGKAKRAWTKLREGSAADDDGDGERREGERARAEPSIRGAAVCHDGRSFLTDVTSRHARDGYARRETLIRSRATPRLLDGTREQSAVGTTRETTDDSPSCNDWRGRTANDDTGGVPLGGSAVYRQTRRRPRPLRRNVCRVPQFIENSRGRPNATEAPQAASISSARPSGRMFIARADGWTVGAATYISRSFTSRHGAPEIKFSPAILGIYYYYLFIKLLLFTNLLLLLHLIFYLPLTLYSKFKN